VESIGTASTDVSGLFQGGNFMIDDSKEVAQLLQDMEEQLPIAVRPTPQLSESLRSRGTEPAACEEMQIESLLYLGDEGGIACGLKWPGSGTTAVVASLTHVRVDDGHPLAKRIKRYQSARSTKIALMNRGASSAPVYTTSVRPRKKRRGRHGR